MAKDRIEELETALRILWGAMLAAKLAAPDNIFIQAAFAKADAECRKTGLIAKAGCVLIEEPAESEQACLASINSTT